MSNQPIYWNKAKKYLSQKDVKMKHLIKKYSDANLTTRKDDIVKDGHDDDNCP